MLKNHKEILVRQVKELIGVKSAKISSNSKMMLKIIARLIRKRLQIQQKRIRLRKVITSLTLLVNMSRKLNRELPNSQNKEKFKRYKHIKNMQKTKKLSTRTIHLETSSTQTKQTA